MLKALGLRLFPKVLAIGQGSVAHKSQSHSPELLQLMDSDSFLNFFMPPHLRYTPPPSISQVLPLSLPPPRVSSAQGLASSGSETTEAAGREASAIRCEPECIPVTVKTQGKQCLPAGSRMAQWQSICLPMQETQGVEVQSLGQEDALEYEMATHCSILDWEIAQREATVHGVIKNWTQPSD